MNFLFRRPRGTLTVPSPSDSFAMLPSDSTTRRKHWVIMVVFALIILPVSLYGFGAKFVEFIAIARGRSEGLFAVTPIVNYLCASLGFLCLLLWATFQGMFRDVERPKFEHLEREAALDRPRSSETDR